MLATIVSSGRGRGSEPAPPYTRRYGGASLRQTACRVGDHGRITHNPPSPPCRPCFLSANNPAVLKVFFFLELSRFLRLNDKTCRLYTLIPLPTPDTPYSPQKKHTARSVEKKRLVQELSKAGDGCRNNEGCSLLLLLFPLVQSMQGVENREG